MTVSFAQLEQSEEYKHLKLLERVSLFDTVNVEFPALNVSATARVVKLVYDGLADRVKSVNLGSVRANIADTIANQQTELEKTKDKPTVSMVQKISSALAKAIMGANGGAVRLIDTNDDGEPDELYIADNADPAQAVKVWRFNYNGWAASKNGYSGPFEFGATLEDGLLANFVTAAQLVAGTIKSQDNGKTFFLDLDNGVLNMNATSFNISGKTVDEIAQTKATGAVNAQTQADIFNKLTENGELKGIYMEGGELFINASYLKSGIIDAAVVQVVNLVAERVSSVLGNRKMGISGAAIGLSQDDDLLFGVTTEYDNYAVLRLIQKTAGHTQLAAGGDGVQIEDWNNRNTSLPGSPPKTVAFFGIENGEGVLNIDRINGMAVSWQSNANGTHTLIGTEE